MSGTRRRLGHWLIVLLIVLVGYCLQVWDLDANSIWTDERASLEVISQPSLTGIIDTVTTGEGRPPLYWLLLKGWTIPTGQSDYSLRYLSVLFSVMGVSFAFAIGRVLLGASGGVFTAALTATAPYFVLYGRMIRAYPMTVVVGLASCYFFLTLRRHDRLIYWVGYILASVALLYTDYVVITLIAAQNIAWLWLVRRKLWKPSWIRWITCQVLLVATFAPWVPRVLVQSTRYHDRADFTSGLVGYTAKLLYPLYSFAIGETIFPWHPAAVVGVALVLLLAVWGCLSLYRRDRAALAFVLAAFITPLFFMAFLFTTWLAPVIPFITFGSRLMFAGPILYVAIAAGLLALRRPQWRMAAFAAVILARVFALNNYYNHQDFHNAIFVVPAREIANTVSAESEPDDMIIAELNLPIERYYTGDAPLFNSRQTTQALEYIQQSSPSRVWVVNYERDRSTATNSLQPFWDAIQDTYVVTGTTGYVPQNPLYARVKVKLLGHAGYEYKASLMLYVRKELQ